MKNRPSGPGTVNGQRIRSPFTYISPYHNTFSECSINVSGVVTGGAAGGNHRGLQIPRPSIDWL